MSIPTSSSSSSSSSSFESNSISSLSKEELLSLILVGAIWGITNPFLRKGSITNNDTNVDNNSTTVSSQTKPNQNTIQKQTKIMTFLKQILQVSIWLPYLLNQLGSILFYKLLSTSDLSIVVPICNAMALIVSAIVGYYGRPFGVGEQMDQPKKASFGVLLVVMGVALCMQDKHQRDSLKEQQNVISNIGKDEL